MEYQEVVDLATAYGQASRELYEAERVLVRAEREALFSAYDTGELSGKNERARRAQEGGVVSTESLKGLRLARNEAMAKAQQAEALVKLTAAWLYSKGGDV